MKAPKGADIPAKTLEKYLVAEEVIGNITSFIGNLVKPFYGGIKKVLFLLLNAFSLAIVSQSGVILDLILNWRDHIRFVLTELNQQLSSRLLLEKGIDIPQNLGEYIQYISKYTQIFLEGFTEKLGVIFSNTPVDEAIVIRYGYLIGGYILSRVAAGITDQLLGRAIDKVEIVEATTAVQKVTRGLTLDVLTRIKGLTELVVAALRINKIAGAIVIEIATGIKRAYFFLLNSIDRLLLQEPTFNFDKSYFQRLGDFTQEYLLSFLEGFIKVGGGYFFSDGRTSKTLSDIGKGVGLLPDRLAGSDLVQGTVVEIAETERKISDYVKDTLVSVAKLAFALNILLQSSFIGVVNQGVRSSTNQITGEIREQVAELIVEDINSQEIRVGNLTVAEIDFNYADEQSGVARLASGEAFREELTLQLESVEIDDKSILDVELNELRRHLESEEIELPAVIDQKQLLTGIERVVGHSDIDTSLTLRDLINVDNRTAREGAEDLYKVMFDPLEALAIAAGSAAAAGISAYLLGSSDAKKGPLSRASSGARKLWGLYGDTAFEEIKSSVNNIAQYAADRLLGQSDPPEGPLSTTNRGARAVGQSWANGFYTAAQEGLTSGLGKIRESIRSLGTYDKDSDFFQGLRKQRTPIAQDAESFSQEIRVAFESPLSGLFKTIPELLGNVLGGALNLGKKILAPITDIISGIVEALKFIPLVGTVVKIIDTILDIGGRLVSGFYHIGKGIFNAIRNVITTITLVFQRISETILKPLLLVISGIVGVIRNLFSGLLKSIQGVVKAIISVIKIIVGVIKVGIKSITFVFGNIANIILAPFRLAFRAVPNVIFGIVNAIISPFKGMVNILAGIASSILGAILKPISLLAGVILKPIENIVNSVRGAVSHLVNAIVTPFISIVKAVKEAMENLVEIVLSPFVGLRDLIVKPLEALVLAILHPFAFIADTIGSIFRGVETAAAAGNMSEGIKKEVDKVGNIKKPESLPIIEPDDIMPENKDIQERSSKIVQIFSDLRTVGTNISQLGLGDIFQRVFEVFEDISDAGERVSATLQNLNEAFAETTKGATGLGAVLAAITPHLVLTIAGFAAVASLAFRGAGFKGIIDGFRQTGVELNVLREATKGTINDLDLMRITNVALAGAGELVREEFGEKLPQLMIIAQDQALKIGKDIAEVVESLTEGVKKNSVELIDNTGLVIKSGEAKEKYAKEIGKATDALSAEESQIAILNAVLVAGRKSLDSFAEGQETATQKIDRLKTSAINAFNAISTALQPSFEGILDFLNGIVTPLSNVVVAVANVLGQIARVQVAIFNKIRDTIRAFLAPIVERIRKIFEIFAPFIKSALLGIARAVGLFVGIFVGVLEGAYNDIKNFVQAVADLLIGKSPPPEGPLRYLDVGARNLADTWVENFAGASLSGIDDVAQYTADHLLGGSSAKAGPLSQMGSGGAALGREWVSQFTEVSLVSVNDMARRVNRASW